jgi:DNA polymerase-3 subunit beta
MTREGRNLMEITAKRQPLAEALAMAQAIATTRSTRPVLQNLLLTASKTGLTIAATDMEMGLRLNISTDDCKVIKEGSVLVSAQRVAQIARTVEVDEVSIKKLEASCSVRAGKSVFDVVMENVEDFPEIPEAPQKAALEVEGEKFSSMTRKTIFAAAREATRYSLNGVHVEAKDGSLELVATDGRRLALVKERVAKDAKLPPAIVPQKALGFVERLIADGSEKLAVAVGDRQIFFTGSKGSLVSRLVEGHFPPYSDVIPKDNNRKATISRTAFVSAMRQSALMTSEESKSVVMAFAGSELTITSRAPDEGSSEVKLDIKYDGAPVEMRFNPQFIIDALLVSAADDVTFEMKEPATPAVLKDGTGFLYVVMPIHIV